MEKRFVDAEAVKRMMQNDNNMFTTDEDSQYAKTCVDACPTADVRENTYSKWVWNPNAKDWGLGGWVCDACGCDNDNLPDDEHINPYLWAGSKFCPNCGSIMGTTKGEK